MSKIVSVKPYRCRMWHLHDRLDTSVNEETCRAEIQSFLKHGQIVPALGRALRSDPDYEVELICGARRLFVAQHLNRELLVELRELSDSEAIVAMDIENRERKEISPYELGICYASWLRKKVFATQEDIARALRRSPSQISRNLKLASLPAVIVGAFESPVDICETWGIELADAWADPAKRPHVALCARALSARATALPAKDVYRHLLASCVQGRAVRTIARDEVVKDGNGQSLFRIRARGKWISLLLPVDKVSSAKLTEVRYALSGILQPASAQMRDSAKRFGLKPRVTAERPSQLL